MKRQRFDLLLCFGTALFYFLNRFWLQDMFGGWLLPCYANDVFAGLVLVTWLDLALALGCRGPIHSWRQTIPFLLLCGFVWEVLAPLWKAGAVFDPWDFLAYQVGGFCYLLLRRINP